MKTKDNDSVFGKMHMQWFGDRVTDDPEIPTDDFDSYEIVDEKDFEDESEVKEEDNKITLTPEEFQELKNKSDSASALRQGVSELGEVLNKSGRSKEDLPQQQPGESFEDFKKRFEKDLFGDHPADALEEYLNRKLGPLMQQVGGVTGEQAKELLSVKDDTKKYFNRYKKDIEEYHDSLPAEQKSNPRSWKYAYDEVLKAKRDDIINSEVEERFEDMFAQKMKEMGMEPGQKSEEAKKQTSGVFGEGPGMVGHNVGPKKTKKVKITPEQKREADIMGLEYEDYLLGKGLID